MGMIIRKWTMQIRKREKLEPQYDCFGWITESIEDKYDLKYFLLNRNQYEIKYLYILLDGKEYKRLEDYIYSHDKKLYYDIISWSLFKEWINIYINNKYPNYLNSFSNLYTKIRLKKIYKKYIKQGGLNEND